VFVAARFTDLDIFKTPQLDIGQFETRFPSFPQAGLILHGLKDDSVPVENSVRFAEINTNVRLTTIDSGHELTDVKQSCGRRLASSSVCNVDAADRCEYDFLN
jgi:hypothetical protein